MHTQLRKVTYTLICQITYAFIQTTSYTNMHLHTHLVHRETSTIRIYSCIQTANPHTHVDMLGQIDDMIVTKFSCRTPPRTYTCIHSKLHTHTHTLNVLVYHCDNINCVTPHPNPFMHSKLHTHTHTLICRGSKRRYAIVTI